MTSQQQEYCFDRIFANFDSDNISAYFLSIPFDTYAKTLKLLRTDYAIHWIIYFALSFSILSYILKHVVGLKETAQKTGTEHAVIVSYELVGAIVCGYMSFSGILIWFGYLGDPDEKALNFKDPYSENSAMLTHCATPMLIFQVWNFLISFKIKEYSSYESLIHHAVVIWVVYLVLDPLWNGYSIFYIGICEFSSIFFAVCQIFRYVEPWANKYSAMNKVFKILFPMSFFIIRLGLFMAMNVYFYIDTYKLICVGDHSEVKSYASAISFVVINAILSYLQITWSYRLGNLVKKTLASPTHETDHGNKSKHE